jgi:F-type H+-transporting ATPase subunit b
MKNFGRITRIYKLVAAVCFAVSIVTVAIYASASTDTPAATAEHASDAAHAPADNHAADMAHDEGSGAGGHGEGSLSPAKLKDLFWRVINFIALMIILVKFGAKPLASALGGRQESIKNDLEDLEVRKVEAEKQFQEFEAKLATVEKDIDTIVDKAVAQAEVEKAKILEKAEAAVEDMKRQAELTIQNEIVEARRDLKNDIADQAAVMAEELIVKNLTAEDQVKISENYLDKVGAVQ